MTLKLVLISPSGTFETDGKLNVGDMHAFGGVISRLIKSGIQVAIWSNRKIVVGPEKIHLEQYMSDISGEKIHYVGAQIGMPYRQNAGSVQPILQKFGVQLHETLLVGTRNEDLRAGVNNQLLLLRPAWYGGDLEYGFRIDTMEALARFCLLFGTRQHQFYWGVNDQARGFLACAMGPFSTYIPEFAIFGNDAKDAAKLEQGTLDFWHQLVISTLYFSGLIHRIEFIAIYPGHAAELKNKVFHKVLEVLGNCFRKPFLRDLLVRHQDAVKSTTVKAGDRKFSNQINSIYLNERPLKPGGKIRKTKLDIRGKCVLVVDDICTSGRSLDVARIYLAAAGAKTILFSWLKTVNTDFLSISPDVVVNPYQKNIIASEPPCISYDYKNNIVDHGAVAEIADLLKKYRAWKL